VVGPFQAAAEPVRQFRMSVLGRSRQHMEVTSNVSIQCASANESQLLVDKFILGFVPWIIMEAAAVWKPC
jgi:hypothetical protein